jgi:hypothetical protein
MGRILGAIVACWLAIGVAGLEGRRAHPDSNGTPGRVDRPAVATFSLADGVIAGSAAGGVDGSFAGTGRAVCFLPGTFDVSVDGASHADLQPSSHCGYDVSLRIDGFAEVRPGEEAARPMTIRWTDLAGRAYNLRFEAAEHEGTHDVRVVCLGADDAGCRSAVVDSWDMTLISPDGVSHDTGPRARLSVASGSEPADVQDLGVYDVPFTLTIDGPTGRA